MIFEIGNINNNNEHLKSGLYSVNYMECAQFAVCTVYCETYAGTMENVV
jgi:hypothetical protein